jgi:tRNA/tmRNA/rRNA uracil-C5-methylase (TrmA/RlmC/RlmD family)
LLVDPPRSGLHESVCRLAAGVMHILYISCGHEALLRDLNILGEMFEVVDCVLLDLFPGTRSVESLVHLQRRGGTS